MDTREIRKQNEILMVEDNPGDARLVMEALQEGEIPIHLSVAKDGVEGLAFLHREGKYANAHRPSLILLDINLPKKNGWEVLKEIKKNFSMKFIPVVIFLPDGFCILLPAALSVRGDGSFWLCLCMHFLSSGMK